MAKTRTGRFALLRQLLAEGITCMFGNPGTSEENLIDALLEPEFHGFKYYLTLHEGSAVAMADAYARCSKRAGVVQLHSYAGLANGLGMLYYSKRGYTPLVVLAGEAGIRYDALDGQMSADLVYMARPFVKSDYNGPCAWRVLDSSSLLRLVRRAVKTAMTPPCGPVFLVLPMDVLDQENNEPVVRSSVIEHRVAPELTIVKKTAAILKKAKNPIILMGDGIAASGAEVELTRVAELAMARVWGVNNSEVNMPASHPLFMGDTGHMFGSDSEMITKSADAILICGTTIMPEVFPSIDSIFAPQASVIHFDLNTYEIGKNFPVTHSALADPKSVLQALAAELVSSGSAERTLAQISSDASKEGRDRNSHRQAESAIAGIESNAEHSDPNGGLDLRKFMEALRIRLTADAVVFDEALTFSPQICEYIPRDKPGTYFQTRAGMLGTGLPGAIGLKVAKPDRMVLGFVGDGGAISTIQALNTARRYGIGVKIIICNNESYRILKYNIQRYWAANNIQRSRYPIEFDLSNLDFVKLAEGHGVSAVRITSDHEIEPGLVEAFAEEGPFLIELMLGRKL